jgi:hypothetical protein
VHLLPSDAPAVQVSVTNGEGSATITRPPGVHGFPWSVYYADCGGTSFDQRIDWSRASLHFRSGCSPLVFWHVLVGWWGHSVATIDVPGGQDARRLIYSGASIGEGGNLARRPIAITFGHSPGVGAVQRACLIYTPSMVDWQC